MSPPIRSSSRFRSPLFEPRQPSEPRPPSGSSKSSLDIENEDLNGVKIQDAFHLHTSCEEPSSEQNGRILSDSWANNIFHITFYELLHVVPGNDFWSHGRLYSPQGSEFGQIFRKACFTVRSSWVL
jgi:hypothetical protein